MASKSGSIAKEASNKQTYKNVCVSDQVPFLILLNEFLLIVTNTFLVTETSIGHIRVYDD